MKVIKATIRAVILIGAYALSATVAGVFYTSSLLARASYAQPGSFSSPATEVLIVFIVGSYSAALLLMTLPWILVVWIYRWIKLPAFAYFPCASALLMVFAGSAVSSMSPKPLFIEDQTFMQGVLIAIERQGISLALAGAILGLRYWFLAERSLSLQERLLGRRDTLEARS